MKNILLIEDDVMFSDTLKYILKKNGHSVIPINKPSMVMEQIERLTNFDVIILDIMMRRALNMEIKNRDMETGEFIYSEIRKNNKEIPILIISAKDKDDINIRLCKKTSFTKKPISDNGEEVLASIKDLTS